MFHDSGNFCHCGLSLKVTPAAVEEEEVHAAKLFCCVETLFMFMCFFIFFQGSTFLRGWQGRRGATPLYVVEVL